MIALLHSDPDLELAGALAAHLGSTFPPELLADATEPQLRGLLMEMYELAEAETGHLLGATRHDHCSGDSSLN